MTLAALDACTPGTSPLPPWQHAALCFQSWSETSTCNSVLLAHPSSSTHRNPQTCFSMSSRRPRHPPCCPILASSWAAFPTPPNPNVFHEMGCLSKSKEIRRSQAPLPEHLYPSALTDTTHRPESCARAIACKHWIWSTAIPGCPPRLGPQHSSGSPVCFPGLLFLSCKRPFHTSDPLPRLLPKPQICRFFGASFSHSQHGWSHPWSFPSSHLRGRVSAHPFQAQCFYVRSWPQSLLGKWPGNSHLVNDFRILPPGAFEFS